MLGVGKEVRACPHQEIEEIPFYKAHTFIKTCAEADNSAKYNPKQVNLKISSGCCFYMPKTFANRPL